MLECGYVLLFLTLAFCDALWIWPFGHIRIRGLAGLWLILFFILIVSALLMMYMICSTCLWSLISRSSY